MVGAEAKSCAYTYPHRFISFSRVFESCHGEFVHGVMRVHVAPEGGQLIFKVCRVIWRRVQGPVTCCCSGWSRSTAE